MSQNTCTPLAGHKQHFTVAQVIERFYPSFFLRYGDSLSADKRKALQAILQCRTESMGGHQCYCTHCKAEHFYYHSCNHRNCPRCGAADTQAWVQRQLENALPLSYYMITFTLPEQLRPLARTQPKTFYPLLFKYTAQTLKDILANPKHLGIKAGFWGVLQTWQQDLTLHPHIHYVLPGGGLDPQGNFIKAKQDWLVWGDIFSRRFKNLLLTHLKQAQLIPQQTLNTLWKLSWNTDIQNFGNGHNAIKYLGQYIFKTAITDPRIVHIDNTHVTFTIKDRQTLRYHKRRITGEEFLRRYLLHVLPSGFHRIRYYGFLHPRSRHTLERIRTLLRIKPSNKKPETKTREHTFKCPRCGHPMELIEHKSRAPPHKRNLPWLWKLTKAA